MTTDTTASTGTTGTGTSTGSLPRTGSNEGPLVTTGLALVLLGGGVLIVRRRQLAQG